jgi:hypothetical protein
MLKIYESHHVDTPFIKKNYKDALCKLESDGRITAEPKKRPAGTFGDKVMALFPTLKGAK